MQLKTEKLTDDSDILACVVYPEDVHTVACGREEYSSLAVLPVQTHSLNVGVVTSRDETFHDTDALVTFCSGLPIGIVTADCVPILIYCPDVRGLAAVHAGWRGTLGGILDNVIDTLTGRGADPAKMRVWFGPSISKECYEVDESLADKFRDAGFGTHVTYPTGSRTRPHIDLQAVNVERLTLRGVPATGITTNPHCTYSTQDVNGIPVYQSHRRSAGSPARNLTLIELLR